MTGISLRSVFIAGLIAFPLAAAQKPNFTGTWKLNIGKSDLGRASVQKLVVKVTHQEPSFKYQANGETANGPISEGVDLTTDGTPQPYEMGGPGKMSARWQGTVLMLKFEADNGQFTMLGRMALSADGKTMTHEAVLKGPDGESKRREVYEKQ